MRKKRNRAASKGRAEIKSTTQNTKFDFAPFLKRGGKGDDEGKSPGVNLNKSIGRGRIRELHKNCEDWLIPVLESKPDRLMHCRPRTRIYKPLERQQ